MTRPWREADACTQLMHSALIILVLVEALLSNPTDAMVQSSCSAILQTVNLIHDDQRSIGLALPLTVSPSL